MALLGIALYLITLVAFDNIVIAAITSGFVISWIAITLSFDTESRSEISFLKYHVMLAKYVAALVILLVTCSSFLMFVCRWLYEFTFQNGIMIAFGLATWPAWICFNAAIAITFATSVYMQVPKIKLKKREFSPLVFHTNMISIITITFAFVQIANHLL